MLREEITARLNSFLIGTIAKSPAMTGYGLTTKLKGQTVSLYVRKGIARKAQEMNRQYNKMWLTMQKLSRVNWEILKLENE
jgi:hypothetical protein